jgi:hypothetical protein
MLDTLDLCGVANLMWAIWCNKNGTSFEEKTSFIKAVFREVYWLRFWFLL